MKEKEEENKKKKRVRYPKNKRKSPKHYVLDVHDSIISGKVKIGK